MKCKSCDGNHPTSLHPGKAASGGSPGSSGGSGGAGGSSGGASGKSSSGGKQKASVLSTAADAES